MLRQQRDCGRIRCVGDVMWLESRTIRAKLACFNNTKAGRAGTARIISKSLLTWTKWVMSSLESGNWGGLVFIATHFKSVAATYAILSVPSTSRKQDKMIQGEQCS